MQRTLHILGVMSGSSLDGLDLAMVRFLIDQDQVLEWALVQCREVPIPDDWKARLAGLAESTIPALMEADAGLGQWIGQACRSFLADHGILPDAIASHGHTILHAPEKGCSLQIGSAAWIAQMTGCLTITDFRNADIAAGGQGAPLAPVVEKYGFPGYTYYLNLGGIANLSVFETDKVIRAWDVAPCNQVLNYLASKLGLAYDAGGQIAARGSINEGLVRAFIALLSLPHTQAYSMDNSWLQQRFFPVLDAAKISIEDKLASVTQAIAQCIAEQIRYAHTTGTGRMLISGGGAHNQCLVDVIRRAVSPVIIEIPDTRIIDFKEAILMAFCGVFRLIGKPNAFASVTGATHDTVNGVMTFPANHS